MKRIPIIIDADPGTDDAFAIMLALCHSDSFDVKLITTTEGNIPLDTTTKNVLYLVEAFSKSRVPVAKGKYVTSDTVVRADDVHGVGGLGDFVVPELHSSVIDSSAVEAMYSTLQSSKEKVVICALAPLSNVADLLLAHPDCVDKIDYIFTMSGSREGKGNIKPYAEFNAYFNPKALDIVLKSGVKVVMNPMELGLEIAIPNVWFYNHDRSTHKEKFIYDVVHGCHDALLSDVFVTYDILVPYCLLHPEEFEFRKCNITISLDEQNLGQTLVEWTPNGRDEIIFARDIGATIQNVFNELYK